MNEINITRLVDTAKLRPFHLWLAFWCLLAMMADGFDLLNASIAGPALIKEWGIDRAALGPVFSASLVGFFVGAPFFGYLGDRYGRRLAIISSLFFIGITTLGCAFARDLQELLWLRFLSGLGLGGVLPNVIALNGEFTPKRLRATMLVIMSMGISLGGAVPGLVGVTLMPTYGWPVIFIVGGIIPIVIGFCAIFALPDSIKFLVLRGGHEDTVARLARKIDPALAIAPGARFFLDQDEGSASTRGSPTALFRNGWALVTVLVWVIFVLNLTANNLMNAWLPMIVQSSGHGADARQPRRLALSARRLGRRALLRHPDRPLRTENSGDRLRHCGSGCGGHRHARAFRADAADDGVLLRRRHCRHAERAQCRRRPDLSDGAARQWRRLCARHRADRLDLRPADRQPADAARNAAAHVLLCHRDRAAALRRRHASAARPAAAHT